MDTGNIKTDIKILVLGAPATGKTSFIQRWTKGVFNDRYKATIIAEFGFRVIKHQSDFYRVQLWDIGGQDFSGGMVRIFAKDSLGVIIVTEIEKPETLEDSLKWKGLVDDSVTFLDGGNIPSLLIENKIDLIKDENVQESEKLKLQDFCEKNGFTMSFITSVKEEININEAMKTFIENVIERLNAVPESVNIDEKDRQTIILDKDIHSEKGIEKKKCCPGKLKK